MDKLHWHNAMSLLLLMSLLSTNGQNSQISSEEIPPGNETYNFDRPPSRYVGLLGETRHFPCFPEYAKHSDARVDWELPDHVTCLTQKQYLRKNSGIFVTKNNTLVFQHLSSIHSGVFRCRLLYKDIHIEAAMHVLVVQTDMQNVAFRLVVGAGCIAGFLLTYAVLYLSYKLFVCWRSCSRQSDSDLHTIPLRRM